MKTADMFPTKLLFIHSTLVFKLAISQLEVHTMTKRFDENKVISVQWRVIHWPSLSVGVNKLKTPLRLRQTALNVLLPNFPNIIDITM